MEITSISAMGEGKVIDWAVMMRRMPLEKQMTTMLEEHLVSNHDMEQLAGVLTAIHQEARIIPNGAGFQQLRMDFNDIENVLPVLKRHRLPHLVELIQEAIKVSDHFLVDHLRLLHQRREAGFIRDVHGDLHCGNVFMTDPPVIFDCVEYNDSLRQIDLLNEIAFLAMSMDWHGQPELGRHFLAHYQLALPVIRDEDEWQLFLYYKLYRANVRLKVGVLLASQQENLLDNGKVRNDLDRYASLLENYLRQLSKEGVVV